MKGIAMANIHTYAPGLTRVYRLAVVALLCLSLGMAAAFAQSSRTPKMVAEAYMAAVNQTNWRAAAAQMHPQSLEVIHKVFIDAFENSTDQTSLANLYGVKDVDGFKQMPPEEFFIRFMSTIIGKDPQFAEAMRHIVFKVEEEEVLSDSEVMIRYSASIDNDGSIVSDVDTMVLRLSSLGWKIYSTPDLEPLLKQGGQ
ncbi:MAG: hypothetical protein MI750_16340 [Xanthomonadales bacterium]|jgi:hypothetical protein|nr:hypothetical protein [Xanthomonadales bacterium]